MAKILWYGDACCNTGFGRVTHSILEHLHKEHDLSVLGINYAGDPHDYPYKIYPAAAHNPTDRFGLGRVAEVVKKENPDVFIGLQDIWMLNQVWEKFQFIKNETKTKFIGYFPTDSEAYYPDMLKNIEHWDIGATFTVGSGQRIGNHPGLNLNRLAVIPHGVDSGRFYPMDKAEARKKLAIPQDKFIVFNGNRNQPRKRIDLTIEAFAEFAKGAPDSILYLHMGIKDLGWDVLPLFERAMRKRGLEAANRLLLTSQTIDYMAAPPDEILNLIYNATDVGINTAEGEGWGLVSFEHASCKKPQIVPNHSTCKDIWKGAGELIDIAEWVTDKDLGVERGLVSTKSAAELLTLLYKDKVSYNDCADQCYRVTQDPNYDWKRISGAFNSLIHSILA